MNKPFLLFFAFVLFNITMYKKICQSDGNYDNYRKVNTYANLLIRKFYAARI